MRPRRSGPGHGDPGPATAVATPAKNPKNEGTLSVAKRPWAGSRLGAVALRDKAHARNWTHTSDVFVHAHELDGEETPGGEAHVGSVNAAPCRRRASGSEPPSPR